MKQIPPVDLTRHYKLIQEEANSAVLDILNSGNYIGGQAVATFEQEFADYLGVRSCVSCNSGTDALLLALQALEIGPGDEVITTPFSFFATAEVITRLGAIPVFVDIDCQTFNLDTTLIESAITSKTKAIIPVHLFGQPADMTAIMAIAKQYNLYVIEDCAQATGASWNGQRVGAIGDVGCFSFFPTKNLGACGDGGAVSTDNEQLAQRIRILKEHGSPQRYRHDYVGINSRLDAVQAVVLSVKLRHLDYWNQQRSRSAEYYQELLQNITTLRLPVEAKNGTSVWNQYSIRVLTIDPSPPQKDSIVSQRDLIKQELLQQGVMSMIYYPIPLHLQPVYENLGYQSGQLPAVEKTAAEVLSLPMFPGMTEAEQKQVANALKNALLSQ